MDAAGGPHPEVGAALNALVGEVGGDKELARLLAVSSAELGAGRAGVRALPQLSALPRALAGAGPSGRVIGRWLAGANRRQFRSDGSLVRPPHTITVKTI